MFDKLLATPTSWEQIQNTDKPIILYGTGNGADLVMDELERLGVRLSAVTASEGFVRSRDFRGYKVRSISDIHLDFPDPLVVLSFASSIPSVMDDIKKVSEKYETIMPVVPVFGSEIFNRRYVEENLHTLKLCRNLLCDEESVRVFDGMIRFTYTGKLSYLFEIESPRDAALLETLKLTDNEHMLDLGAYRGDTIEELINVCGGFASAVALEPDKKTFEKLQSNTTHLKNVTLYPYAVWNTDTELEFFGGGGRQSTLCQKGKYTVKAVAIDNLIDKQPVTYVKMDVEGVEKEALEGMAVLINRCKPKLCVSAYHRTDDLCTLIPLIHKLNPDYKIHLRHHPYIPCWDTNLYCV